MNRERIITEANHIFSGLTKIGEELFKGELKLESRAAGVYFIDLRGDLNVNEFKDYQEKILYEEYYKQEEALQWNLYLLFISDYISPHDKEIIESDQKYARKYVFTEDEFVDYFKLDEKVGAVTSDVVIKWKRELDEADLQEVYSSYNYSEAVPRFLSNSTLKQSADSFGKETKSIVDINFINRLSFTEQYRKGLDTKEFSFGKVNLFKGVNGSGKTSTLEAIELIVCGRNFRNKERALQDNCVSAIINGGVQEFCAPSDNGKYRLRDQKWYSNVYRTGNTVFNSFNRFNYFDSDAASNFSQSNSELKLKEALQNLVLGDEFKYIKDRVNGFLIRLSPELNRLNRQIEEANKKRSNADISIASIDSKNSTTLLLAEVRNNLDDLKLRSNFEVTIENLSRVEIVLNDIKTLLGRISSTKLHYGSNLRSLFEVKRSVEGKLGAVKSYKVENEKNISEIALLERRLGELNGVKELLRRAVQILERPQLLELEGLKDRIIEVRKRINGIGRIEKELIPISYQSLRDQEKLLGVIDKNSEQALAIRQELGRISFELGRRISMLSQIDGLVRQIRDKGNELFQLDPEILNCPLCDTVFKPNELVAKLDELLGKVSNYESNVKSTDLNDLRAVEEEKLKEIELRLTAYKLLDSIYQYVFERDTSNLTVNEIIDQLEEFYSKKYSFELTLGQLERLRKLGDDMDLSEQKLQDLKYSLYAMKGKNYRLSLDELSGIKDDLEIVEANIREIVEEIKNRKSDREISYGNLMRKLDQPNDISVDIDDVEAEVLKDKVEIISLFSSYEKLSTLISYSSDDIAEDINLKVSLIERNLESLKSAAERDLQFKKGLQDMIEAEAFLKENEEKIKRLRVAVSVLERLNDDAGLSEMSNFFDSNVKQIVEIFKLIHSPREFVNLVYNDGIIKLIDRDGDERSISEISTGQRAALALSIFVSMNRMLKSGPNVILFDDPVAHIDDLNALSFLDFLRIFVLREKKQIFFASANARLSRLFERKFEFLGDKDFKKWDLSAAYSESSS